MTDSNAAPAMTGSDTGFIYLLYASLLGDADTDVGLGGKLVYAGQLTEKTGQLIRAANIAGAASLTAASDPGALRQAMREGIVDFVVNSLDEALRILKNEVRKQENVAVGVTIDAETIEAEMVERGVQPDLLTPVWDSGPAPAGSSGKFVALGARPVSIRPLPEGVSFRVWSVPKQWTTKLSELDARLVESVATEDKPGRRWLRLAPRYLGPLGRRFRSLACDEETARKIEAILAPHDKLGGLPA